MRDPLDLRGKTMTELMDLDQENDYKLDRQGSADHAKQGYFRGSAYKDLLADRRQIREEMQRRRNLTGFDAQAQAAIDAGLMTP